MLIWINAYIKIMKRPSKFINIELLLKYTTWYLNFIWLINGLDTKL